MGTIMRQRTLAVTLATALVLFTLPTTTFAGGALFQGKVVTEDGVTPVEGVVVRLALKETGTVYDSNPSTTDGGFKVDNAPVGEYEVLAQHGDVGYLTAESVNLKEGENKNVSIVIQVAPAQTTASKLPLWGKIAIAGTIIILTAAVFDKTGDEGNDSVTPF